MRAHFEKVLALLGAVFVDVYHNAACVMSVNDGFQRRRIHKRIAYHGAMVSVGIKHRHGFYKFVYIQFANQNTVGGNVARAGPGPVLFLEQQVYFTGGYNFAHAADVLAFILG